MFTTDFTHRASPLDNQFGYILDEIEAANILGEIVKWSRILYHQALKLKKNVFKGPFTKFWQSWNVPLCRVPSFHASCGKIE